jgi:hypothetical protein
MSLLIYTLGLCFLLKTATGLGEIIYAINSGGPAHTDIYGIHYEKDSALLVTTESSWL